MAKTLVYQLYPRAWDGGLKAMTEHLFIINYLGADYVWLSPIYPSPGYDHGYDIKDYTAIDDRFGNMADFDYFVKTAHSYGIGVVMDLVLNHTSISHPWFTEHPEYYYRTDLDFIYEWQNLFDGTNQVWELDKNSLIPHSLEANEVVNRPHKYYLHLFHKKQADLDWFPWHNERNLRYKVNQNLVREFKQIVDFWINRHGVDGFRLDFPQAINKDINQLEMQVPDLLFGSRATEVINAIFSEKENPFLMMECLDPTYGGLTEYYYENTHVDYILNTKIKDAFSESKEEFEKIISSASSDSGFMLDLESHDSPRFPSRGVSAQKAIDYLFGSGAEGVCLYQGQELGLINPSKKDLPNKKMLELDAWSKMRAEKGEPLDDIRPKSRANARIPLPLEEYRRQLYDPNSILNYTKTWIDRWKQ